MTFLKKIKNWMGSGQLKDYWWLNSKEYLESWNSAKAVKETGILKAKSKSNVLLEENVNLSIENDFEGIIIGKKNNKVRIDGNFSGIISCDLLYCTSRAVVKGDLFINNLTVEEGHVHQGETNLGQSLYKSNPIQFADLGKLAVSDFVQKQR